MTGWQEILLVLIGILILFGAKKLPDLARALGKSLRKIIFAVCDAYANMG